MTRLRSALLLVLVAFAFSCAGEPKPVPDPKPAATPSAPPADAPEAVVVEDTCTGTFPSYWQDPNPKFAAQWEGQKTSNAPPAGWQGPQFRLSDKYPRAAVDDRANQPWRDARFDAMFAEGTSQEVVHALAKEYAWEVMRYIQAGNIGQAGQEDWDVCKNPVRPWFHIPFQTYDALSGREFTHGLTREAPVTFSIKAAPGSVDSTMWAIGLFNATAAYTLGKVWQADGTAVPPLTDISFDEGAVVGKPLFNTSSPEQLPVLANMPAWKANISATDFCNCVVPGDANAKCTLAQDSEQCPRSLDHDPVRLLQFDFAVKDSRAPGTKWVFGTFAADGRRKASESNPWNRISVLGVMWGNDTPPAGQLAYNHPANPKQNGFEQEAIFWDLVDELNAAGGTNVMQQPGHLGCNFRLNGPADNANSSCMSCHGSASAPDKNLVSPPLISQFSAITKECVTPNAKSPKKGVDRTGAAATVNDGVSFSAIDSIYFANTAAGAPFNTTVQTPKGPINVMGAGVPAYADSSRTSWISLDYSLQLNISLTQWGQWQRHQSEHHSTRVHTELLRRGQ